MNPVKIVLPAILVLGSFSQAIYAQEPRTAKLSPKHSGDVYAPKNQAPYDERWLRHTIGKIGLSLELPGEPEMLSLPPNLKLPADVTIKTFRYRDSSLIVSIVYAMTSDRDAAWNFIDYAFDVILNNPTMTDVKLNVDRSSRAARTPVRVTCKIQGVDVEIRGTIVFLGRQNEVAFVLAQYYRANTEARAAAARSISSVHTQR
jgi:hypothetical protein